jgi:hypothetical protein
MIITKGVCMEVNIFHVARIEKLVKEREMPLLSDFISYEAFDEHGKSIGEVSFYSHDKKIKEVTL